jgi:hypothetical protein
MTESEHTGRRTRHLSQGGHAKRKNLREGFFKNQILVQSVKDQDEAAKPLFPFSLACKPMEAQHVSCAEQRHLPRESQSNLLRIRIQD